MIKLNYLLNKKYITGFFIVISTILFFQNCGDIKVAPPPAPLETVLSSSIEAQLCPAKGNSVQASNRVLFVVDMSLSNLGGSLRTDGDGGNYVHQIQLDQATDRNAARLKEAVVKLTTALDPNSTQFSVIGFNDTVVMNTAVESCSSAFISATQVLTAAEPYLYSIHMDDLNNPYQITTNPNSPFKMRATSYMSALDCLEKKITTDVQADTKLKAYNIVFITDGAPTDAADPCDNVPEAEVALCKDGTPEFNSCRTITDTTTRENCNKGVYASTYYKVRLESLRDGLENRTLGIKMHSIYYGPNSEFSTASNILNQLNHVFDADINTQKIVDFSSVATSLKNALDIKIDINYRIVDFATINLTSIPGTKELSPDSNMNGISDLVETTLEPDIREIFNTYKTNFNQDRDELPSFLEKIRGLSVSANDASGKSDGDDIMNYAKVFKGYPLKNSELINPTRAELLPVFTSSRIAAPTCGAPGYEYSFSVNSIPLVKGLVAYTDPMPDSLNFSHNSNENLVLLLYTAEPLNTRIAKRLLFGQVIKLSEGTSSNITLNASDFKYLGELQ